MAGEVVARKRYNRPEIFARLVFFDQPSFHILSKHFLKLILSLIPGPFMQDFPLRIQQIKTGADAKAEICSKVSGLWIADFQIRKLDLAKVLCFEPMHHGRHLLAGRSPKFKEFDKLQGARGHADRLWVGSFEMRST